MFNPQKEGNSIAKAIGTVLENQCIKWHLNNISASECHTACVIGLANSVYDTLINAHGVYLIQNGELKSLEDFENFINSGNEDYQKVRDQILKTALKIYED